MKDRIDALVLKAGRFLRAHAVGDGGGEGGRPLTGDFSLYPGQPTYDLYGAVDAVYILFTLGLLRQKTDRHSRQVWAERILACQDDDGWFSRRNLRGHTHEHATAYALGALTLLEVAPDEEYVARVKPIIALLPLLTDQAELLTWLERLDFRLRPGDIRRKKLGWHYVWRGSHVGGGVGAIVAMAGRLFGQWWPGRVDVERWFGQYFSWLDAHVNPATGCWQRAFWNRAYRRPTVGDMGGAAHFLWVYEARGWPFPYPEQTLRSTLSLQRPTGLYRRYPMCIDLDGNFCLARSYRQLSAAAQERYRPWVARSLEASFTGVVDALLSRPLPHIYRDLHGLPGALVALAECRVLPDFRFAAALEEWHSPFDRVCWL